MKAVWFLEAIVAGGVALACGGAPTTPTPEAATAGVEARDASGGVTSLAGMTKESINGTIQFVGSGSPGRSVITPSGHCHFWELPVFTNFGGDVEGRVTFNEQIQPPCDFSRIVGSGPFDGEVVWNGRSGTISGQWTTNCKADTSQPTGVSCDGTMNARGSGGLEGVQFHFKWGPGWFPFPYTGTAFSN